MSDANLDTTPLASEQITQEDRDRAKAVRSRHLLHMAVSGQMDAFDDWAEEAAIRAMIEFAALSASPAPSGQGIEFNNCIGSTDTGTPVAAPSGQGVSGEGNVWTPSESTPGEPIGALLICDQTGGRMWTCWPVPHMKRQHAESIYADTGGYRTVPLYAASAPSCAPGEVERLAVMCRTVADRATANLDKEERRWRPTRAHYEGMRNDVRAVERALAALSPQGLDAKEGGHPDDVAVDLFAARMKEKLAAARAKGRSGWDDPVQCSTDYLRTLLHEHVAKGDPVDVANFCMMLAHYDASTATPSQRLDAATVEREWSLPDLRDLHTDVQRVRDHDLGNKRMRELLRATMDTLIAADAEYAALATEPHQHGGKGA